MGRQKKEGQVTCPICNSSLSVNSDMNRHLEIHNKNRKKFPCTWPGCNYAASQKSNLKFHMHTHQNLRPYACKAPLCKYAARDGATLIKHETNVHGFPRRGSARQRQRVSPYVIGSEGHASSSRTRAKGRTEVAGDDAAADSLSSSATSSPSDASVVAQVHPFGCLQDFPCDAPLPPLPPEAFDEYIAAFTQSLQSGPSTYAPPSLPFPLIPQGTDAAPPHSLVSPYQAGSMANAFCLPAPMGFPAVRDSSLYDASMFPMPTTWQPDVTPAATSFSSAPYGMPMTPYDAQVTSSRGVASGSRFPGSYDDVDADADDAFGLRAASSLSSAPYGMALSPHAFPLASGSRFPGSYNDGTSGCGDARDL